MTLQMALTLVSYTRYLQYFLDYCQYCQENELAEYYLLWLDYTVKHIDHILTLRALMIRYRLQWYIERRGK